MALDIVRRIRGNVHGTIDISVVEDRVLAHPFTQRLRRIRQLAFLSYVFPGASHSRFEHSLGVMHLADVAWNKLVTNQMRLAGAVGQIKNFNSLEIAGVDGLVHGLLSPTFPLLGELKGHDYGLQALRLAAFLHDLGHPPFSHSGERFLPTWAEVSRMAKATNVSDYLRDFLDSKCQEISDAGRDPAKASVRHEVYTLLLADRLLKECYVGLKGGVPVAPRDVLSVINPNIAPEAQSPLNAHGLYRLLNEMISGECDIDRMDYLLRDSRECGVVYGIFDADRILDSLALYQDSRDLSLHLAINFSGLAAFEDYLRARYSMYLQLYFHKTSVAAEAMMQSLARMLGGWTLPSDVDTYAKIDEHRIAQHLIQAAEEKIKPGAERELFMGTLDDLLYSRRLWKRVFEISTTRRETQSTKSLDKAKEVIEELGFRYEQVSSTSSLTRFIPRDEDQLSNNYLRLIKKDENQIPRVVPIEDYSPLIRANDNAAIKRLYVECGERDGVEIPTIVKRKLTEVLSKRP